MIKDFWAVWVLVGIVLLIFFCEMIYVIADPVDSCIHLCKNDICAQRCLDNQ